MLLSQFTLLIGSVILFLLRQAHIGAVADLNDVARILQVPGSAAQLDIPTNLELQHTETSGSLRYIYHCIIHMYVYN